MMLIIAPIILAFGYTLLMLLYREGWHKQKSFKPAADYQPKTKLSIIIPARNEARNIEACLRSVLNNNYPPLLYEVIVIDDHSTDETYEKTIAVQAPNLRCIRLSEHIQDGGVLNAYKKKAIETAIGQCSGELIVTTDADCMAQQNWLLNIAACYEQNNPVMIIGAVDFTCNGSMVEVFQSLDFMSMQGITVAAHTLQLGNMSNGANLAFSRRAFEQVEGYKGIDNLASGDDYLLMMKMQKAFPGQIAYLKTQEAIVRTAPQPGWSSFLNQRIRWASKSGKYDDKKMTATLAWVYLYNLSFLYLFIIGFWMGNAWRALAVLLIAKIITELFFLFPVAQFFHKRRQLRLFPLLQPLHIAYIILAGMMGWIGIYSWKGRKVK